MTITLGTIADWTQGRLLTQDASREVRGFSTDSRVLQPGDIFLALRGPTFDGHDFRAQAVGKGACAAIVEREDALHGWPGIVVPDVLQALGRIAHRYRWQESLIPWIAVTGTNGKTTTREMVRCILAARGVVATPPKNYNNLIGLPLSILQAPRNAWAGVLEMGTNTPGEIDRLAEIATPTVGIVTTIGPAHLQGLGSILQVAREKACIFDRLPRDGLAIYPATCPYADILRQHIHVRAATFASQSPADLVAEDVHAGPDGLAFRVRGVPFQLNLLGRHNVGNALAALLATTHLGISLEDAAAALRRLQPVQDRLQVIETDHFTILNDVYNANPQSLQAALEVMDTFDPKRRRVVVVGDMLELGSESRALHREAGFALGNRGIDVILAVGKESIALAEGAASASAKTIVRHFRTVAAILRPDERYVKAGDLILVKGSRGMHLEHIVAALLKWQPPPAGS